MGKQSIFSERHQICELALREIQRKVLVLDQTLHPKEKRIMCCNSHTSEISSCCVDDDYLRSSLSKTCFCNRAFKPVPPILSMPWFRPRCAFSVAL